LQRKNFVTSAQLSILLKNIFFVIDSPDKQARVFVTDKILQIRPMFWVIEGDYSWLGSNYTQKY
jgi:hypothetical protein